MDVNMADDAIAGKRFSFTFSYALDDLLRAINARKKIRPFYRFHRILSVILIAVIVIEVLNLGFLFVISVLLRHMSANAAVNDLVKIVAIIFAILIIVLVISILDLDQTLSRWRIKRGYRKNQTADDIYEIIVDSEALQVNVTDWKTWIGWSRVQDVYVYRHGFLLFFSKEDYLNVPIRVFEDPQQIEAFNNFLAQSIGKAVVEID
jgi:hypothetical protein